jgi:GT2 family glycosyltransferase/nucleoside-diphosphate-sugar epimerase
MVSYHTGPALWPALASCLRQPECDRLILVNNGNSPGVNAQLQDYVASEPRLRLIEGQGNVGFARACNLGAKAAEGEYLLLLNPDSLLAEGALAQAVDALSVYPPQTLMGGVVVDPDGTEQRGGRRALLNPKNAVVETLRLQRFFPQAERFNFHQEALPDMPHDVPAISGACMFLRLAFYRALGGLDEGYFLHMEDMDFCYRVHQAGGTVVSLPALRVLHFRSTSDAPSAFVEGHKARGFVRYLKTHFKGQYSAPALAFFTLVIWAHYYLKTTLNRFRSLLKPPLARKREVAQLALLYRESAPAPHPAFAGRRVIVTGASGQVGLNVIARLLSEGAIVTAVYHTTVIPFAHPNLAWAAWDLRAPEQMPEGMEAEILIHTAELTLLPVALPALMRAGVRRIVAFSSTSIFGKAESTSQEEQALIARLRQGEEEIFAESAKHALQTTILRPTMIYGEGLDGNVTRLSDLIRRRNIAILHEDAKGLRAPVQAGDLAVAALQAIDAPASFGKAYNLSGGEILSFREMLLRLFQYHGRKPRLIRVPMLPRLLDLVGTLYQMAHVNGDMAHRMNQDLVYDSTEAERDFGYRPHGFLQGRVVL